MRKFLVKIVIDGILFPKCSSTGVLEVHDVQYIWVRNKQELYEAISRYQRDGINVTYEVIGCKEKDDEIPLFNPDLCGDIPF